MKQQPDKFFEDYLKDFGQTPPSFVWGRIEEGLDRKAGRVSYLKIAASLLILLAAGSLLWTITRDEQRIATIDASQRTEQNPPESRASATIAGPTRNLEDREETILAPAKANGVDRQVPKNGVLAVAQPSANATAPARSINSEIVAIDSAAAMPALMNLQPAFRPAGENITIILSYEETKQYLKESDITDATSGLEKTSTFKKLLKKAADLSSNQDPFGDLRQKKNEILALNFGADKPRGQKK